MNHDCVLPTLPPLAGPQALDYPHRDMYCTFCEIVAGREPARVRYEDDDVLVFDNVLGWVPVMLLVIPKRHLSQEELWNDIGAVGRVALEMGRKHCPGGFRLLSNLGHDAMQSQPHGHVHVLGGAHLGLYVR